MKPRTNNWLAAGACALALTLAGSAFAQAGNPAAGKAVRERVRAEKAAQRAQAESPEAKAARRAQKQGAAANRPVRNQQGLSFQAVMRQADKDNNGTISPDEFHEAMDKVFKETDLNRDGVLQRNEIGRANRALFPAGDTTGQRPEPPAANIWERVLAQDRTGMARSLRASGRAPRSASREWTRTATALSPRKRSGRRPLSASGTPPRHGAGKAPEVRVAPAGHVWPPKSAPRIS